MMSLHMGRHQPILTKIKSASCGRVVVWAEDQAPIGQRASTTQAERHCTAKVLDVMGPRWLGRPDVNPATSE